jgi:hypothetical protein
MMFSVPVQQSPEFSYQSIMTPLQVLSVPPGPSSQSPETSGQVSGMVWGFNRVRSEPMNQFPSVV